jgi:N-acetylglutamate synthase-like GNAT family acetyltransferase
MIRPCQDKDFSDILDIINDAAGAYKGIIPSDCWHEPYMSPEKLAFEINDGIRFSGWEEDGKLVGVMGIQDVKDVTLIRHAYVRTAYRNKGIGGQLLKYLRATAQRKVLIGTWKDAVWAIRFYEKHGFSCIDGAEKDRLLKAYWKIPSRQVETSVVLEMNNEGQKPG